MSNVENLKVREKSVELATTIYLITKDWKDFWLTNQIQRSAVSISSNIAEWADRETTKEYIRFLYIARWSCSELKTQITIAKNIGYININQYSGIITSLESIHKMINGLINHLKLNIKTSLTSKN